MKKIIGQLRNRITNNKEDIRIQNLWDTAKAVLIWKFIAIQSYLRKQEKSQNQKKKKTNNPNLTPKATRERRTRNHRRKEIIKIRAEISEIETKKTTKKINETKNWFFRKINKIVGPLARLKKEKRERAQINKIRT